MNESASSSFSEEELKDWVKVLDTEQISRSITRLSHEILENNKGASRLAVVGVRTRGEHLAERIVEKMHQIEGEEVPLGVVDITLYRDDINHNAEQPIVRGTNLPFNVDAVRIILVDDVLYTGRTIRAALDAIIDFGRPRGVQLAVLVDRGHRELPIRPDFVGKSIPTSKKQAVRVHLVERDGEDAVYVKQTSRCEGA